MLLLFFSFLLHHTQSVTLPLYNYNSRTIPFAIKARVLDVETAKQKFENYETKDGFESVQGIDILRSLELPINPNSCFTILPLKWGPDDRNYDISHTIDVRLPSSNSSIVINGTWAALVFDLEIFDDDPVNITTLDRKTVISDAKQLVQYKVFVTPNLTKVYGDGMIGASPCTTKLRDYSFAHQMATLIDRVKNNGNNKTDVKIHNIRYSLLNQDLNSGLRDEAMGLI